MMQSPTCMVARFAAVRLCYTSISPYYFNTTTVLYFVTECSDVTVLV